MEEMKGVTVVTDGHEQKFHGSWYRGESTNFIPSKEMLRAEDALERFILHGWLPDAPFIGKRTSLTAFGSCFAAYLTRSLAAQGYNVNAAELGLDAHIIRFGEGIVNSFAIREQFEWALEGKSFEEGYWFGEHKEIVLPTEGVRQATRRILLGSEVIVLTLGLSEIWYDKVSGRAFWRAIPDDIYDESRHGFRLSSVEENLDNLVAVQNLIRKHIPDCKVIVTLSPIPLMATFRPISCLSANSVSKAVLRVAVDELMRRGDEATYYFPSYEIVKEFFTDPYGDDNRHVRPEIVQCILNTFAKHYCLPDGA